MYIFLLHFKQWTVQSYYRSLLHINQVTFDTLQLAPDMFFVVVISDNYQLLSID